MGARGRQLRADVLLASLIAATGMALAFIPSLGVAVTLAGLAVGNAGPGPPSPAV